MDIHNAGDSDYPPSQYVPGPSEEVPLTYDFREVYRAPQFTPCLGAIKHHRAPLVLNDGTGTIETPSSSATGGLTSKHKRRLYRTVSLGLPVRRAYLWCLAQAYYGSAVARLLSRIVG